MPRAAPALALLGCALLAGCATEAVPAPTSAPLTQASGDVTAPVFPVRITRTGGVAGMHDTAVIDKDGRATVTTRSGSRSCTLGEATLRRLAAAAAAVSGRTAATTAAHPDDLVVVLSTRQGSARLEDPALQPVAGAVQQLLSPRPSAARPVCR